MPPPNQDWSPVASSSASYCTHRLVQNQNGYVFRPTTGHRIFPGLFLIFGVCSIYLGLFRGESSSTLFLPLVVGIPFVLVAIHLLFMQGVPTFDIGERMYYKAGRLREWMFRPDRRSLDDIEGVQVLSYLQRDSEGDYTRFQLNIVFKDGKRVNVVAYRNGKKLAHDAQTLAVALGVPLWQRPSEK